MRRSSKFATRAKKTTSFAALGQYYHGTACAKLQDDERSPIGLLARLRLVRVRSCCEAALR